MTDERAVATLGQGATEIVASGGVLSQTQVGYQTAVYVQKARNIDSVVKAVEREAQYAAESAYYSWKVKDKKSGKMVTVEGLSIGGEMAIAREWGNCAIPVEIEETSDAYIFTASFVDLERGFTVSRVFKQTKTDAVGKYADARWNDMQLQIGQSKAIRNAIKAGTPAWLQDRALKLAKKAVIEGISKEGIQAAIDKAINFLAGHGITESQIVVTMGKAVNEWTPQDVATLRGMCQQINDGTERAETLFGVIEAKVSDMNDVLLNKKTGEILNSDRKLNPIVVDSVYDIPMPDTVEEQEAKAKKPHKNARKPDGVQEDPAVPEMYQHYMKLFTDLTTVLDCNRWLMDNRENVKAALSDDYQTKFFSAAQAHIDFIKSVAKKEAQAQDGE